MKFAVLLNLLLVTTPGVVVGNIFSQGQFKIVFPQLRSAGNNEEMIDAAAAAKSEEDMHVKHIMNKLDADVSDKEDVASLFAEYLNEGSSRSSNSSIQQQSTAAAAGSIRAKGFKTVKAAAADSCEDDADWRDMMGQGCEFYAELRSCYNVRGTGGMTSFDACCMACASSTTTTTATATATATAARSSSSSNGNEEEEEESVVAVQDEDEKKKTTIMDLLDAREAKRIQQQQQYNNQESSASSLLSYDEEDEFEGYSEDEEDEEEEDISVSEYSGDYDEDEEDEEDSSLEDFKALLANTRFH